MTLDHVSREFGVGFEPSFPLGTVKLVPEDLFQRLEEGFPHDGKHVGLDAVTLVLGAQIQHDFREQLNVGALDQE